MGQVQHTHTINSHTHTFTVSSFTGSTRGTAGSVAAGTHNHSLDLTSSSTTGTGTISGNNNTENRPSYMEAAFIQFQGITVSGTSNTTGTVKVAVNGTLRSTSSTISGGNWSMVITKPATNDVITAFIDGGADDSTESTAVTTYTGSGNVGGMVLNTNILSIGSDQNQNVSVTNLSQYDCTKDEDVMHSVAASVLRVEGQSCAGAVNNSYTSEQVNILGSDTLTISGTEDIYSHDIKIDGTLTSGGASDYFISGSWDNNSVFTASTSTVTGNATSGSETIDSTGASTASFNNLTLGSGSGSATWSLSSALDVNGTLSIAYGTLSAGTQNVNGAGIVNALANGTYSVSSGTLTLDGTGTNAWYDSNAAKSAWGTVVVDGTARTAQINSDINATKVTVGADDTLTYQTGTRLLTLTGSGTGASRPFVINVGGTFTPGSNLNVKYTGAGATEIQATSYYGLELSPSATGYTYTLGTAISQTITTTGAFSVNDGSGTETLTVNWTTYDSALSIQGNLILNDYTTWTKSDSATLTFAGSGTSTWADNGATKQDLGAVAINGSTKTINFGTSISCTSLNIYASQVFTNTGLATVTITGSGTGASRPFIINGTLNEGTNSTFKFVGTSATTIQEETYYNIQFMPASGSPIYTLATAGSKTVTISHDMTVGDGANAVTVTANTYDPTLDINGTLTIAAAGIFTASDSGTFTIATSYDNNGTFNHSNGKLTFDAGAASRTVESGGTTNGIFYDLEFSNGAGGWTVQTDNTKVAHDFTLTSVNTWTLESGRTLEVDGQYTLNANASLTTWTGSTLYLNSGTNYTVGAKTQNTESYGTLQIGANTDIRMWKSSAATYTVDSSGSLYDQNAVGVSGRLYIYGDYHVLNGATDYWSYANDFDGTAGINRQANVIIDPAAKVTIDSGGSLQIIGTAGSHSLVTRNGAANGYELVCDGGTIDISYTDFDYLDGPAGLDIKASSTVTDIDNSTFENLVGTGGTDANITVVTSVIGAGNKTLSGNSFTLGAGDKNVARTGSDDVGTWDFDTTNGEADDWNNTTAADEADPGMLVWNDSSSGNVNPNTPTNLGPAGYIDAAGWMNDNTPSFNFDLSDDDVGQQVKFRIQIDDTAGFGSPVVDYTSALGAQGTFNFTVGQAAGGGTYTVGSGGQTLSDSGVGGGYYWQIKAIDDASAESSYEEAGVDSTIDFRVDATAPTGGTVNDGAGGDQDWNDGDLDTLQANWSGFDASASGLDKYEYAVHRSSDNYYWSVCSGAGAWQVGANWCDNGVTTNFTQNNINLQTGENYYVSVRATDNAGNTASAVDSDGQQVLPTLSFSLLPGNTITFADLNDSNSWTDTEVSQISTSTNASLGYVVQAYETTELASLADPGDTISDFSASWGSPKGWGGGVYGFGYSSDDTSVQGSNRFGNNPCGGGGTPPCYAPFKKQNEAPGDIVADHTAAINGDTGAVSGEQFEITYKVAVSTSQPAATYQTYVIYVITANF